MDENGEPYKKVKSFLTICNEKGNPDKWLWHTNLPMREVAKRKKVHKLFLDNDFMPVTLNGVEYLPNVQAVLYNYFQTMTTYPVYVNSDVSAPIIADKLYTEPSRCQRIDQFELWAWWLPANRPGIRTIYEQRCPTQTPLISISLEKLEAIKFF